MRSIHKRKFDNKMNSLLNNAKVKTDLKLFRWQKVQGKYNDY